MNLEDVTPDEINQSQYKYCMIPLIWSPKNSQIIETESWMMVAGGREDMEYYCLTGTECPFCKMKACRDGGDSSRTMRLCSRPLNWLECLRRYMFQQVGGHPMSASPLLLSGVGQGYWGQNHKGRCVIYKTVESQVHAQHTPGRWNLSGRTDWLKKELESLVTPPGTHWGPAGRPCVSSYIITKLPVSKQDEVNSDVLCVYEVSTDD